MDKFKEKSESLAAKMNNITSKLTENLDLSDELEVVGSDIVDFVDENTHEISLFEESAVSTDVINLELMINDFKFVRESLKENSENGRRVLNSITVELLDKDIEKNANLISSFAELNHAVVENMKLYISAYKDISSVLLNINKIKQAEIGGLRDKKSSNSEAISTADIINSLNN